MSFVAAALALRVYTIPHAHDSVVRYDSTWMQPERRERAPPSK